MHLDDLNELQDKDFISATQHSRLVSILSRKIFSVYYELRIVLYLGVMLFTTGVGILIYKNIGEVGHMLSIGALFILTATCFWYSIRHAQHYSNYKTTVSTPYYDYIVLLGCLLFISVLGYLQFQYSLFDDGMGATTLVTALLFFYAAYRFDHLGVLSLAIAGWASFWSISVSPQKWYSGDFFEKSDLHITAIVFGAAMAAMALLLDRKNIKTHFTFTYINFSSLIYLTGALSGIFINYYSYVPYLLALYAGCGALVYYAHRKRSFLFLLYAFVFAYIGTTYFLTDTILRDAEVWFFYLIASCGAFIYFIVRYKSYFRRAE